MLSTDLNRSGLWTAQTRPAQARSLADCPLIVLVGVTGVGKSTALAALPPMFRVLPDRREITDAVMLWPQAGRAVSDRQERFTLTARYRQTHPGGMAQALGELWAAPQAGEQLVFDGLRGLGEVRYAAEQCAGWRFVNLHAPDLLRLRRLLGRHDAFDRAAGAPSASDLLSGLQQLEGVGSVFTPAELEQMAALQQHFSPAEILSKARIVLSERQHYDPEAAREYLLKLPAGRVLDLDTGILTPGEVARRTLAWL